MKVTIISENSLPMSTGGGPRLNQYAICEELRQRGHQVQIIWITTNQEIGLHEAIGLQALQARGMQVIPMPYATCNPSAVSRLLGSISPDVVFGLGTYNIAWAAAYNPAVPRICMLGDPEHIIQGYRRQYKNPEPMSYEEIAQYHNMGMQAKESYLQILQTCTAAFCAARHSTKWFQDQGLAVEYIPMPVVEPAYLGWRRRKEDMPNNPKPRILMAGHLGGIATLSSLYYLADEVLPHMDDIDDYDWHICGGDTLQEDLVNRFKKYPQIQFRGYVEDIRKEILQADIFLCTTSTTVGVRTRLVEAMALGSCIVAHSANGFGQPEFISNNNILLPESAEQMIVHIKELGKDSELRHTYGLAARQTYEDHFRTELSAGRIIDKMEEVVRLCKQKCKSCDGSGYQRIINSTESERCLSCNPMPKPKKVDK